MRNILITYSGNWADEISVSGYVLADTKGLEYWRMCAKHSIDTRGEINIDIGTNENIVHSSIEEYFSRILITNLSYEQVKAFEIVEATGVSRGFTQALSAVITRYEDDMGLKYSNIF